MAPERHWLDFSRLNGPQVGFVGALAFAGSGATAFGLTAMSPLARASALLAVPVLFAGGIVLMALGHISAWQNRAHRMTLVNITTMSVIAWGGLSILALNVDPIPFLSTITASLISLGIAWGIPLMKPEKERAAEPAPEPPSPPDSEVVTALHGIEDGRRQGNATSNEEE